MAGTVIAIGGAEDKLRDRVVLRRFVAEAGSSEARIVILATASELPDTGARYADIFTDLRCDSVDILHIAGRQGALEAGAATHELLARATGVFMTGGNQLRITSALGGTPIEATILRRHREGAVVGGTSAGAAVLSEHMIAFGNGGGTPRRRMVQLAPGLGLLRGIVVDQHFRQRDRLGRLLAAISFHPGSLGVGVDENTAAVVSGDRLEVIGAGAVTVVDASGLSYTDCERATAPQPVALLGLRLDVLNAGCGYDLASRRAVPPGEVSEGLAGKGLARKGSASAPDGARFIRSLLATAGETNS